MKRFALALIILLALPISATFAIERAPFYGVIAGSMVGVNDFATTSGGLQIGTMVSIDDGKGLSLRTLYTKAKWGDLDFEAYRFAPMLSWYAGKNWDFYVLLGGTAYQIEGETGGDYFVGFGTSRRLYTAKGDEWAVPFTVDGFLDFTTDDMGGVYDNVAQITLGIQFSKPIKK